MSFTAPTRQRSGPVLPLAGMVDVLFLLLIFFITTAVFRELDQVIDVSLPATESGEAPKSSTQIIITVTDDDEIFMGEKLYTQQQLRKTLHELAVLYPNEAVVIRADFDSRTGTAVTVMDIARSVNLTNIFMATSKQKTP